MRRFGWWMGIVAGAVGGGYLTGKLLAARKVSLRPEATAMAGVLPVMWLVLFWHEAGHAIGGALMGFRLEMLAVGPLRVDRAGRGWRLSLNRSPALWGGVVMMRPVLTDRLVRRMLGMTAAGPAASWLGALLGAGVALAVGGGWSFLAGVFALTSALIGCLTLIPSSVGGLDSDGRQILRFWRGGPEAEQASAVVALGAMAETRRAREWPPELVERASAGAPSSYSGVSGCYFRHHWHVDRRELDAARVWLERTLAHAEHWPAGTRAVLYSSAVWFYAVEQPDRAAAERYYAQAQGVLPPEARAMHEAAYAHLQGDASRLATELTRARELTQTMPGSAGEAVREYLARLS